MPRRSCTSNFKRSFALGTGVVVLAQIAVGLADLNSASLYGRIFASQQMKEIDDHRRQEPIDVVGVGHSHLLNGFDAGVFEKETGLSTHNLGIASTDLYTHALLIRDFVIPFIKPRYIYIDISAIPRSTYLSNVQIIASDGFALQQYWLGRQLLPLLRRTFVYQKRPVQEWISEMVNQRDWRCDRLGYMAAYRKLGDKRRGIDKLDKHRREPWKFPFESALKRPKREPRTALKNLPHSEKLTRRTFEEALDLALENRIRIIPYSAPQNHPSKRLMESLAKNGGYRAWIEKAFTRRGIKYFNYRFVDGISTSQDKFYDPTHLNWLGAEEFTRMLAHQTLIGDSAPPDGIIGTLLTDREKALMGNL